MVGEVGLVADCVVAGVASSARLTACEVKIRSIMNWITMEKRKA